MMARVARRAAMPLVLLALFAGCVGVGVLALATFEPLPESDRLMVGGMVTMIVAMALGALAVVAVVLGEGAHDDA